MQSQSGLKTLTTTTEFQSISSIVNSAWEDLGSVTSQTQGAVREAVNEVLGLLDQGSIRVAQPNGNGAWIVNEWIKKAVLLSFRLNENFRFDGVGRLGSWWDKVPLKFEGWRDEQFEDAGFRAVPTSLVRRGAYIGRNCVLMPSYVNIGAYVGEGTMVDTWATVGSCAQIGNNVHLSGGVGIGGVLEPLQASPVIIEDSCFVGARSEVVEGVRVCEGAVIAMGVFLSQSTKIVDRASGKIVYGEVPPYSVVVPGTLPDPNGGPSLACAVIIKTVDARTREKTAINELLRD